MPYTLAIFDLDGTLADSFGFRRIESSDVESLRLLDRTSIDFSIQLDSEGQYAMISILCGGIYEKTNSWVDFDCRLCC